MIGAASEFEFRRRFWLIGLIFWAGFSLYRFDPVNAAAAIGGSDVGTRLVLGFGALLCALAALIRSWAGAYLRSAVVHDTELHSDRLVADGPYRYVRNPLYLGTILLACGMGLMASRAGFAVISAGMALFALRLIGREEAMLLASQGESYRRYLAAVPRLIPALTPRAPAGAARPDWRDGLLGETFIWGFAVSTGVFAATESLRLYWACLGASLASYFLARRSRP